MKQKAFTLIELLLVIAIISILAAVGILSYRRYFQVNRIDKVAIGMQHVLEAAMAFYVDKNEWPAQHRCENQDPDQQDFIDNYLPNANYKSYFGTDYCWQAAGNADPAPRLFWVALKIPGEQTDRLTIAKRIAARLPNAITTSDPESTDSLAPPCDDSACYVRAEITVPGASTNAVASMSLAASGDCHTGTTTPNASKTGDCRDTSPAGLQYYTIHFNPCPVNTTPDLRINPNFIMLPRSHNGYGLVTVNATEQTCTPAADPDSGKEHCTAAVTVTACIPNTRHNCSEKNIKAMGGQAGASYIVTCQTLDRRNDTDES